MKLFFKILLILLLSSSVHSLYGQCSPSCNMQSIGINRWCGDGDNQNSIPDITTDDVDGDDFIAFKNFGSNSVNISGWQVYTDRANQAGVNPVFTFPSGTILASGQSAIVVAQWNGAGTADNSSPALPFLWFDADFHTGGEGLFDETSLNYAHLRNPSTNQYITISLRGTSNIPNFPLGVQICETNLQALLNDQDFNGCEQIVWDTSNCSYTVTTTCDIPEFNEPCTSIANKSPQLTSYNVQNSCNSSTVNLNGLHISAVPASTTLVWYTNPNHIGTEYSTPMSASNGTYYAFYYNSTNSCYSLASSPVGVIINTLDSDGDSVFDRCDLDDDNDGIIDTDENYICLANVATTINPNPTASITTSGVTIQYTESGGNVDTLTDPSIGFAGLEPSQGSSITYNFSVPVNNLKLWFTDLDNREYLKINYYDESNNRISNLTDYVSANIGDPKVISSDANYGLLINPLRNLGDSSVNQYVEVTTPFKVKKIEVTFNSIRADGTSYNNSSQTPEVYIKSLCFYSDTDNDGISDYLDLDSDNDGCLDAIEGGAAITSSQLVTASGTVSVGLGSTASNQNLGNAVNANGVPTIAGGGQSVGDSANAAVNSCFCYKPAVTDGNTYPAKHGITALGRAGAESDNWPMVRQSAWTVLEAKTKGFVVNRVAFADVDNNLATPDVPTGISAANFVEGMMVYDITNKCLKVYTSKDGGTSFAWYCMTTQACPQ